MKREVPIAITFISGVLLVIAFFIPHEPFGSLEQRFNDWYIIVSGFALILGIDSLLLHHWNKVSRRSKDWFHSLSLIIAFFVTLIWGFYSGIKTGHFLSAQSTFRQYFYMYVFVPLQATMFSLLAFFIASAAYRAFRADRFEAALLLFSAGIVMLGRVPLGNAVAPYMVGLVFLIFAYLLYSDGRKEVDPTRRYLKIGGAVLSLILIYPVGWFFLHYTAQTAGWIMNIPQLAAKRGIFVGIALGGIAMSLRIILGIEKTYLR